MLFHIRHRKGYSPFGHAVADETYMNGSTALQPWVPPTSTYDTIPIDEEDLSIFVTSLMKRVSASEA